MFLDDAEGALDPRNWNCPQLLGSNPTASHSPDLYSNNSKNKIHLPPSDMIRKYTNMILIQNFYCVQKYHL